MLRMAIYNTLLAGAMKIWISFVVWPLSAGFRHHFLFSHTLRVIS